MSKRFSDGRWAVGVTLITAAVLPELICIATQLWTLPSNEKFHLLLNRDREGAFDSGAYDAIPDG